VSPFTAAGAADTDGLRNLRVPPCLTARWPR
jgi:hypothetical protein